TSGPCRRLAARVRRSRGSTSPSCSAWAASGSHSSGATSRAARWCPRAIRTSRKHSLMADINQAHGIGHAKEPVEGDGVNYAGIGWFLVILTATTIFCQILVWGGFRVMEHMVRSDDPARAPLSHAAASPTIDRGHVIPNGDAAPQAGMLVDEPTNLADFR